MEDAKTPAGAEKATTTSVNDAKKAAKAADAEKKAAQRAARNESKQTAQVEREAGKAAKTAVRTPHLQVPCPSPRMTMVAAALQAG
jgi:hypothetical protein